MVKSIDSEPLPATLDVCRFSRLGDSLADSGERYDQQHQPRAAPIGHRRREWF